jgi:actin-like protein 6A
LYKPPGFFVAKEATLTCYASGRASSLVIDSGAFATTVCAVYDGYVLKKTLLSSPIAGDYVSQALTNSVLMKNKVSINPSYSFKKKKLNSGKWEVTKNNLPHAESFHNYHVNKIVHDMKISKCKVQDARTINNEGVKTEYELPDGTIVQLDAECIYAPNLLFNNIGEEYGVHQMVMQCIQNNDVDIRKELYGGIIVTGGTTLFPGYVERLQKQINVPQTYKSKFIAPLDSAERRFSSWTGGSILGSLGSMHAMWISKQEYEEYGSIIVEKKCP